MSMKLNIQKRGNSAAVRLPASMLAQLGVHVGDSFEVDVSKDGATLRLAKPNLTAWSATDLKNPAEPGCLS